MKTIVNTASTTYCINQTTMSAASNSFKLHILEKDSFVYGEVVCRCGCRRWKISIVEKNSGKTVFYLNGKKNKGFCFELCESFEYKLIFTADKNIALRLYRTPGCVTDIMYSDNC